MERKSISSAQENQTISTVNRASLPTALEPSKLVFRAQIIPDILEQFGADPSDSAEDILTEALKALNAGQPGFDPKDYRIYVASLLIDEQSSTPSKPKRIKIDDKAALEDVLTNGDYVFFVKSVSDSKKLEIWISDQKILVFDKPKVLIGRRDLKKGINPDIDLAPYLAENALQISRKQAWILENDGYWSVCLDENARSPVYLNGEEQLEPGQSYEILNDTRLGFGGLPNQSYLYMTLRITK